MKTRCDRKRPVCSTCVTKRKICQYLDSSTSSDQSSGSPQPFFKDADYPDEDLELSQTALYDVAPRKSVNLSFRNSGFDSEALVPSNVSLSSIFQTTIPQLFNYSCLALSYTETWPDAPFSPTQAGFQFRSPNSSWSVEASIWPWTANNSLPAYSPSPTRLTIEWKPPRTLTPKSLPSIVGTANGRFILQTLRTYPKMMLKTNAWPPIINSHCRYDTTQADGEDIIANCVNIVQMFYARTKGNSHLVWTAIRFEMYKFGQQVHSITFSSPLLSEFYSLIAELTVTARNVLKGVSSSRCTEYFCLSPPTSHRRSNRIQQL